MPAAYRIFFYRDAQKDLSRVPRHDAARIISRIGALHGNPRPGGCEKLSAMERYRLRQGDWRILYEIDDKKAEVTIVKIANRKEAYRR